MPNLVLVPQSEVLCVLAAPPHNTNTVVATNSLYECTLQNKLNCCDVTKQTIFV